MVSTKEENVIVCKIPGDIFTEYYLIRLDEFNSVVRTPLEEWIEYIETGEIKPDITAPGLSEVRQKLFYI